MMKLFSFSLVSLSVLGAAPLAAAPSANPSLKEAARGLFHVGVAINAAQILERDQAGVKVIERQFDSITPENALKWEHVHPAPDRYDFALTDKYVEFGTSRGMFVIGHTLMWHSQTPEWVFQGEGGGEVSKEELLRRLREHIHTVVGRYRGVVKGWDVVNEAIRDEDGNLRTEKPWYRILGEEGVLEAFKAAHEADPDAELYYNDYSLANPVKRAGVLRLVQRIREKGLRIDGVGSQEHHTMEWPTVDQIDATFRDIKNAGFKAMVTELDVTVLPRPERYVGAEVSARFEGAPALDPYRSEFPPEKQAELAKRYGEVFAVYLKYRDTITRVTVWGVADGDSWLNGWPIRGRTDHPLFFDRHHQPKPALQAVLAALRAATEPQSK